MSEEQKQLDAALNNKEIGPEVHAAATAVLKQDAGKMKALPGFSFDGFLNILKWIQSNLPTIQQDLQLVIALLQQLVPKA